MMAAERGWDGVGGYYKSNYKMCIDDMTQIRLHNPRHGSAIPGGIAIVPSLSSLSPTLRNVLLLLLLLCVRLPIPAMMFFDI